MIANRITPDKTTTSKIKPILRIISDRDSARHQRQPRTQFMANRRPWFVALILAVMAAASLAPTTAWAASDIADCRGLTDPTAKLRCYESLTPPDLGLPSSGSLLSPTSQNIGRWRLLRTPNPRGGSEAVSITRTGELSGSDPDFAGLMIRCGDTDLEVLVVLVKALSFRAHPRVSIGGSSFEGTVAPPGSIILLPLELGMLARQSWPSMKSLSIEIADGAAVTKGLVLLDDLDPALKTLSAACTLRQQSR